jgi:hypothetical protein
MPESGAQGLLAELRQPGHGTKHAHRGRIQRIAATRASHYLREERSGHTLQATALVHEVYLRLALLSEEAARFAAGYVQQQTLSSSSTSTISGQFFFGGGAPGTEGSYESGSLNFAPGEPSGTIAVAVDSSRPDRNLFCDQCGGGLQPNNTFQGFPYTFPEIYVVQQ